jgi:hypothetical protein
LCIAKGLAENLLQLLDEIDKETQRLESQFSNMSNAQQDLLHIIELSNFNAAEGYSFAKQLKSIREERRTSKQELIRLKPLNEFVRKHKKTLKNELGNVLKSINSIENKD